MARCPEELGCLGRLDDPTKIHDRDPARDVLHHGKIMADEEIGQPELLAQIHQEVKDLALHADIEGGGRFIADHDLGPHDERAGDGDALTLSARELVGIPVDHAPRQADEIEHFLDFAAPLRRVAHTVHTQRQGNQRRDGLARVER